MAAHCYPFIKRANKLSGVIRPSQTYQHIWVLAQAGGHDCPQCIGLDPCSFADCQASLTDEQLSLKSKVCRRAAHLSLHRIRRVTTPNSGL